MSSDQIQQEMGVLRGLMELGAILYYSRDQQDMLDTILYQARQMTGAQAGSLFLVRKDALRFVAVQNDCPEALEAANQLLGTEISLADDSLAGFVARTGDIANISDSHNLPEGAPFRICREMDAATGYQSISILAIPLTCPDGHCVGVLQLLNHLDADNHVTAFPSTSTSGLLSLASSAAISMHNAALQEQLRQAHLDTIFRLSMVAEYRDEDTSRHVRRVSKTSGVIAATLDMTDERVSLIEYASPMHDVGKVAVPDSILLKPGYLTPAQREAMEKHTVIGAEILSGADDEVSVLAREVALRHHERWDGQGYPDGLVGHAIPLVARIVALADVFDAVVSRRCYKAACSLDAALAIVQGDREKHFDPAVTDAFTSSLDKILEAYPSLQAA